MTVPVYRLPIGVKCSSNNGKVYISGTKGVVVFNSVSNLYRKGDMVIFLPYLTSYYSSIFKQAVQGVIFGYTIELTLKGIGYRVREEDDKLIFSLGYSNPVILNIPKDVSVTFSKQSLFIMSPNFSILQNFATAIRRLRFPDSYKGSGIVYGGEIIICKEGKKT
uniref:Ribosomal protein L6 n=1 Tax=Petalonia binghamiae TaxID=698476 RepID=A0A2H4ZR05_9PHAE|nr:ribosomal protein L6 [Endarachne binghamiae]AUG32974.1 ribosomal protein L6 [Endarachne binghamiae]